MRPRNNRRSLALLLGYSLAGLILLAILFMIFQVLGLLSLLGPEGGGSFQTDLQGGQIRSLQIQVHSDLSIRTGPELQVESQNAVDSFRCDLQDGLLTVSSKGDLPWFLNWRGNRQKVIVTLPEDLQLEEALLSAGAGDLDIDSLDVRRLTLEGGVGDIVCRRLNAAESCQISTGVGDIEILSGQLQTAEISGGVGDLDCAAALLGQCSIEGGVGDIDLTLTGAPGDYSIQVSNGLGDIEIDGEDVKNGVYGAPASPNALTIASGVGDIEIEFSY